MVDYRRWPEFDGHESVTLEHDTETGLTAVIAIHREGVRFAAGGVRMKPYASLDDAIRDALQLSQAMSYKFALSDPSIGGAKSVIIGDPGQEKTPALMEAFGRRVERLGGRYLCGPDVGTRAEDMVAIRRSTRHVRGLPGESTDLSMATAEGVMAAMTAALSWRGIRGVAGRLVAVQGLGKVGARLCDILSERGARLLIADPDLAARSRVAEKTGARVCPVEMIAAEPVDVFAPCAMGGVVTEEVAETLGGQIVCGCANNQLASRGAGEILARRGILYVPDFIASAGGALAVCEVESGPGGDSRIFDACLEVFEYADNRSMPVSGAALELAARKLDRRRGVARVGGVPALSEKFSLEREGPVS